jgi:hypothetical protein
MELNSAVVCVANGVPLRYPLLLTFAGVTVAKADAAGKIARDRVATTRSTHLRKSSRRNFTKVPPDFL